ncbi:TPA: hypothetical protein ACV5ZF_001057 [Salmonella enterica]|uniref:hypothetical protein n=1 Tax=Salmonella enterica TaxID=28901 RepID=UPI000FC3D323|nr:hypothetical protein [Salmonella enterica]ECC1560216.1 hypothetical protein [Salmonella enterica subsp. salamae]EHJ5089685.1 hypothetical protein [Salmonella enterica subsp. salamae serovar 16:m,t:-]HCM1850774.1 hypothetical protein [Salmonella enterica subsp. salamae serovar 42:z29:-]HCM1994874.1 hypothetical protein [Salmonella enterica subsp. salamae serovar 53:z4,z24:-]AZT23692.1 hypothetical protein ELZ76_06990 [Salmonella enterica subsp. salamae serovar 42:r:-]
MKNFLTNNTSIIQVITLVVMIISYILLLLFRLYNKIQARKINNLFILENKIPLRVIEDYLSQSVFFLSYIRVMLPFWKIISSTECNNKIITPESVFFKKLPTKITIGFKIEALMWITSLTSVIFLIISGCIV